MCDKNVPNAILDRPEWLRYAHESPTICIDACIAPVIKALWHRRVVTLGSCCGHGERSPSIVVEQDQSATKVAEILATVDPRPWEVCQWQLRVAAFVRGTDDE